MSSLNFQRHIPISRYTTLNIGGAAKFFLESSSQAEIIQAIAWAKEQKIPYLVIGGGSNLLVSDQGFDGLIIKNSLRGISQDNQLLRVKSGTPLQDLVDFSIRQGLAGLEKLTGIPGTLGGAVYGNAGAYGQAISDQLTEVVCFDGQKIIHLTKTGCGFSYRDSNFKRNSWLILEANFKLAAEDKNLLLQDSQEVLTQRLLKYQPGLKCPGSFFKNVLVKNLPPQTLKLIPAEKISFGKIPAGFLLEEVGAKNQSLGNITIAPYHGNLFINQGSGKAKEFYQLAKQYYQKVEDKFGIKLEPEVQFINLPPF